jgi:DNA polymerase-3 subunit gamma/tau
MYEAYITRFRPKVFEEVVGQEGIAETLKNAVSKGRVANGYLFTGPRGVGKTSTARILAKSLNCKEGPTSDPCNKCSSCVAIQRGEDIDVIEIDAASNTSVENVRTLRENAIYSPSRSRYKVYIIDEAHMLSTAAMNALLKILEEPPPHVRFIFATTEPNRIPETVRSRLQRFDFRPIGEIDIAKRLRQIADEEKLKVADEVLLLVARYARGGLRDAEGLLDQLATLCADREIKREDVLSLTGAYEDEVLGGLLSAALSGDAAKSVGMLEGILAEGGSPSDLLDQLHGVVRAVVMYLAAGGKGGKALLFPEAVIKELAGKIDLPGALNIMSMLSHYRFEMRYAPDPTAVMEMAVLRIASRDVLEDLAEIASGLEGKGTSQREAPAPKPMANTQRPADRGRNEYGTRTGGTLSGKDLPPVRVQSGSPSWWSKAVSEIKDVMLRKNLETAQVSEAGADGLVLTVPNRMAADTIAQPERMASVEAAVERAAGRKMRITVTAPEAPLGQKKTEFGKSVKSKSARKIIDAFDGTIESIEEDKQ